ncbi:MAG: RAMP superfamily CRISPR-associated protein [Syntrophorhabdaceae bacterium]|nr:RAMP superfamily CRISPR-associated protein [Syntrophorhabdaceae bacterium]
MDGTRKTYLQKARLTVYAHGYWFTSGGEKGPFGFYPHLKDSDGYPIYPDTQLHGDLRMAAGWSIDIGDGPNNDMIIKLFGDNPTGETRQVPSKLYITDLTLDESSKKKWSPSRFEVKPRIAIDDKTRIVEEHMLLFQEMAYLEDLTLQADVYIGYFEDIKSLDTARKLIDSSLTLLGGLGQSRSRGYGRGEIKINWEEPEVFTLQSMENGDIPFTISYALTNLVHFRNKPVEPGSTQFLPSRRVITGKQCKAWLSKTYYQLSGTWPSLEEMELIHFSDLCPSIIENGTITPGCPPPMTTLRNEKNRVLDTLRREMSLSEKDLEDRENFFKTKTKPLSTDFFVTSMKPLKAFKIKTDRRIRNQTLSSFATNEGGLFVQEFIRQGTCFSGKIKIDKRPGFEDFLSRVVYILKNVKPIINGAIFQGKYEEREDGVGQKEGALLVISPLTFSPGLMNFRSCRYEREGERIVRKGANMITVETVRAYNTTLKRPKRPMVTVKPGSIILDRIDVLEEDRLFFWPGFALDLEYKEEKRPERKDDLKPKKTVFKLSEEILKELKDMTPSQAGFLKEFLNRHRSIGGIKRLAKERKEKYDQKGKKGLSELYEEIVKRCEEDPLGNTLRAYINHLLDTIFINQRKRNIIPKKEQKNNG